MNPQELIANLIEVAGSQERLAKLLGITQGTISGWLSGETMSEQSRLMAERLWDDHVVRRRWAVAWLINQSSGQLIPRKFEIITDRKILRNGVMVQKHVTSEKILKEDRGPHFHDLIALYTGWGMLPNGDFLCFYKRSPIDSGGLIFDSIHFPDAGSMPALGRFHDPILGVGANATR